MQHFPSHINPETDITPDINSQGLRAVTLVRVRWITVLWQSITIFIVAVLLDYPLPIVGCILLIVISAAVNTHAKLSKRHNHLLTSRAAALYLAFDLLQLSVMLFLTGGLNNPFAIFLLAPVLISASSQGWQNTMMLGLFVMVASILLTNYHLPLPWPTEESFDPPGVYQVGVLTALNSCLVFMGAYTYRVADEARSLSAALTATELILAREHRLSALDGLAAAAAHELGTPLSSIAVAARELELKLGGEGSTYEDIMLISSQAGRCRDILQTLSTFTSDQENPLAIVQLEAVVEELAEPYRNFGINLNVEQRPPTTGNIEIPTVMRLPGMLYGLRNIIENAVDFSKTEVTITVTWNDDFITISVTDDGPGFSEAVASRLGEPYITSQRDRVSLKGRPNEGGGLGLGIFIAKTLLERSGATIRFSNRTAPMSGAFVSVKWPRDAILANSNENQSNRHGQEFEKFDMS